MADVGSIINHVLGTNIHAPKVGDGATLLHFTDRSAATVVSVSASGKTAWVQEDDATRTDTNGMSEVQTYTYKPNTANPIQKVVQTKRGWKVVNGPKVSFGHRDAYHDFSF